MIYTLVAISFRLIANNTPQQEKPSNTNSVTIVPPSNITVNCPPLSINLNNQNTSSTGVQTSSQSQSSAQAQAVNRIETTTMITMMNEIKNKMKSVQKYAADTPTRLKPWVMENKWRIVVSCATVLYAYTWYRLFHLQYALFDPNAWHNYKTMVSFDELLRIKQEELAQELIKEIQRIYAPQAVQDFFIPFTLFTKDIEREMELLEQLITIYKRIRMLHINWLFPWQGSTFEQAQDKLRRVLYLRNVAFSWLGSFKLEKYTQLAPEFLFQK